MGKAHFKVIWDFSLVTRLPNVGPNKMVIGIAEIILKNTSDYI